MPENYSDTPLLLHLKLREIEIIILAEFNLQMQQNSD